MPTPFNNLEQTDCRILDEGSPWANHVCPMASVTQSHTLVGVSSGLQYWYWLVKILPDNKLVSNY